MCSRMFLQAEESRFLLLIVLFYTSLHCFYIFLDVPNFPLQWVEIAFYFSKEGLHIGFLLLTHLDKDRLDFLFYPVIRAKHRVAHESIQDLLTMSPKHLNKLFTLLLLAKLLANIPTHNECELTGTRVVILFDYALVTGFQKLSHDELQASHALWSF